MISELRSGQGNVVEFNIAVLIRTFFCYRYVSQIDQKIQSKKSSHLEDVEELANIWHFLLDKEHTSTDYQNCCQLIDSQTDHFNTNLNSRILWNNNTV